MKLVIYQVMPRLFGNIRSSVNENGMINIPNGDIEENGVGKFSMFTQRVLRNLQKFGYTHVWFTGVLDHATQTDYAVIGQPANHHGIVKGKAGSPYAVRDYYNVDPDLADNPFNRMNEWKDLIERTHKAKLKVIMDFIPNHVARNYRCISAPSGVRPLGHEDKTNMHFSPDNNFYYCVDEVFKPNFDCGDYYEYPAKVTGNDCFSASPSENDWYETIKLNYGVDYCGGHTCYFDPIPNTWNKMLDILMFWASKGVDGFRCDMAEMVPVEFWKWAIAKMKRKYPKLVFIAEVYNPSLYRSYIYDGGFDYLYDKVGMYDTLRASVQYGAATSNITGAWQSVDDIKDHMLKFMENHDEQRIASKQFAGNGENGFPAMAISALISSSPIMVYSGQEVGESAEDAEGFSGNDGRTTIFDYWRVDSLCDLLYHFDGGKLQSENIDLFRKYKRLISFASQPIIAKGEFYDLMWLNYNNCGFDTDKNYAFLRYTKKEILLVVANFGEERMIDINLTSKVFEAINMKPQERLKVRAKDVLNGVSLAIDFTPEKPVSIKVGAHQARALLIKRGY